jgi:hypothetical protein
MECRRPAALRYIKERGRREEEEEEREEEERGREKGRILQSFPSFVWRTWVVMPLLRPPFSVVLFETVF